MHNRTADCCSAITTSTAINIDQQKPLFAPHAICRQGKQSLKCNGPGRPNIAEPFMLATTHLVDLILSTCRPAWSFPSAISVRAVRVVVVVVL